MMGCAGLWPAPAADEGDTRVHGRQLRCQEHPDVGSTDYEIFRIDTVEGSESSRSLKVLLENLLRTEDGANVTKGQIQRRWGRGCGGRA